MERVASLVFIFTYCIGIQGQSQTCTTPNGEKAQCISIYSCPILLNPLKSSAGRNSETIRFLRQSQCGYDKNPLVCCGSINSFQPAHSELAHNQTTDISSRNICGIHTYLPRIIRGPVTWMQEFPWTALIQYKADNETKLGCGGVLINERYILTAAHCVTGQLKNKLGNIHKVRLGEWITDTILDCEEYSKGDIDCADALIDLNVEEVIPHPNYSDNSASRYHDIALIRFDRNINFTDFIRPICLPIGSEERASENDKLMVAGWSKSANEKITGSKMKLKVPVLSSSECSKIFTTSDIALQSTQLCAGGVKGSETCVGDSGGPLMNTVRNTFQEQWYVEGISAFQAQCRDTTLPGIYTKVAEYLKWIKDSMRA